jgi:pilus assembly protein Flp/PilA
MAALVSHYKLGDMFIEEIAMARIFEPFLDLAREEDGVTAIEYGLLAALVALGIIAGAGALGTGLNSLFQNLGDWFTAQA